ncbi:MAG: hypothetical protein LBR83_01595 [Clostridiales bacterium]|jgi:hypothetical protein|nr:hypothetical protein [Clostridiales bacterium]
MELIHTLLFMLRRESLDYDLLLAKRCLSTLENCTHKDVLVYNQGFWSNSELADYLKAYRLNFTVIGEGKNVGILNGRQECFLHIWNALDVKYISELHLDMAFMRNWEDHLINALVAAADEPLMCSGIVEKNGWIYFREDYAGVPPEDLNELEHFLKGLCRKVIVPGFTHPCIHRAEMLKAIGGIDRRFLKGAQGFDDDSMLLGYRYYLGARHNWRPKINFNTLCVHDVAGQRCSDKNGERENFLGVVKMYGAKGVKELAEMHVSSGHRQFFSEEYARLLNECNVCGGTEYGNEL